MSAESGALLDDLIEADPFSFTRTDAELRALEVDALKRPRGHWRLLRALLGVGPGLSDGDAQRMWREIIAHRRQLSRRLGRPMPLRAVALDWLYLRTEAARPIQPVVVARGLLERVLQAERRDSVTGLARRGHFERELERRLRHPHFLGGCLVFIDLDGFKRANDELGHAAGDETLKTFARVLGGAVRAGDAVGRMGGDEFALLLHNVTSTTARRIVTRVRESFERACAGAGVSFSFGVARLEPGQSHASALARADAAMYRQKQHRRTARPRSRRAAAD